MTKLQLWMTKHEKVDAEVARLIEISRPQVSRIRRGVTATTMATARKLQRLTGISWWKFMEGGKPNGKGR